jgi:hypothetical protein
MSKRIRSRSERDVRDRRLRIAARKELVDSSAIREASNGPFAVGDARTSARFIIETVTFFARHRFLDPDPQILDDEAVKKTVIDLVTRSLISQVGKGRSPGRHSRKHAATGTRT